MSRADIGMGCVTFGREIDRDASFAILDAAVTRGIRMLDTAANYGAGASEKVLGEWFGSRGLPPATVEIATKIAPPFAADSIARRVEESLERLRLPAVDLLYLHSWDTTAEDVGVLAALDELVREGRVRRLGLSNASCEQLHRAREIQLENSLVPFSAIQDNLNYAVRDLDEGERRRCGELGVRVVTYSPLGAGFLTGKHRRGVESGSRFEVIPGHQDVYFHEEAWARLDRLEEVARRSGIPQVRLALAWAFCQGGVDCVLVGARTLGHLEQAFEAWGADVGEALGEL